MLTYYRRVLLTDFQNICISNEQSFFRKTDQQNLMTSTCTHRRVQFVCPIRCSKEMFTKTLVRAFHGVFKSSKCILHQIP